jgi:hypothetical protein
VTIFARLLSPLISLNPIRRLILASGLAASVAASLLLSAAPAGALVTTVGPVTVGLQPRSGAYASAGEPKSYANPSGNPVLHGAGVYAIYWDPTDHYWSEWQAAIDTYFQNAGAASGQLSSVFAVDGQYTDKSNKPASYAQTFKGASVDEHAYPASGCTDPNPFKLVDQIPLEFGGTPTPVCLTSAQVAAELEAYVTAQSLPKGLGNVYYLLTPPGVTVCLDGGGNTGHCSDYAEEAESYDHRPGPADGRSQHDRLRGHPVDGRRLRRLGPQGRGRPEARLGVPGWRDQPVGQARIRTRGSQAQDGKGRERIRSTGPRRTSRGGSGGGSTGSPGRPPRGGAQREGAVP